MKKVLICGGSGFIGKNVIRYLKSKRYRIVATYNTKTLKDFSFVKWIKSDLTLKKM
jgi:Nucleoside-diphosphate-sugar epimerases